MLEEITLMDEEILESAFENNKDIKKINAPNLIKINKRAFYNCVNLENINAPKLEIIEDFAFYGTNITNFDFTNIIEIGKNAFECSHLEKVFLPKTLKKVGKYAFANNPYLIETEFLSSMTKIKDGMFENCVNLKEIKFSNTINKLGIGVFRNCKKLNDVILPEHLKVIEASSFLGCETLKKIEINDELAIINDYAFGNTKIVDVDLPKTITNIGRNPFYMCHQLRSLKINSLFNDDILDKTNSKLETLIIGKEKTDVLKPIKKVINYNGLIVLQYIDNSFQIISKTTKYYDTEYFSKMFPGYDSKTLMRHNEIFNIFYWELLLGEEQIREINPLAIIALPSNNNVIKAFYHKHNLYDELIKSNNIFNYNEIIALIKFITIFGGLSKKKGFNNIISKIGIKNITKQFLNANIREYNHKFVDLYLQLIGKYDHKEINNLMPFLYNNIERIDISSDSDLIRYLEELKYQDNQLIDIKITKSDMKIPNYEWLDTTKTINLLWGYILASASLNKIDSSDETRKAFTYYIKDDKGMIIARARAYYNAEEKYLLFNSIILSQSFLNECDNVEKIKSAIIDYVLASIEEIINFLNSIEIVVSKVHVGLSEKSIKEQLRSHGTKIIMQNC